MERSSEAVARADRGPARSPNFLIIGAGKGGTTSLFQQLAGHPDVYLVPSKEIHFFDREYERGIEWYLAHFAGAGDQKIVGEATPAYMRVPEAPKRMWELLPDAKPAAILRHPVDRAYSHYWMQRSKFTSQHDFEEIVRRELAGERHLPTPHARYIEAGRYLEQLERICHYYPREQLLVLLMDDLKRDPADVYRTLCRFLEIDQRFGPHDLDRAFNATKRHRSERLHRLMLRAHAWRRFPRMARLVRDFNRYRSDGYSPLQTELRAELLELYRPHNAALASWLGRDLSEWDR